MYKEELKGTLQCMKEGIVKAMQPIAEISYKFENAVNEITNKEAGFENKFNRSPEEVNDWISNICDTILHSRMSLNNKCDTLMKLHLLISYVEKAGVISGHIDYETDFDEYVRFNADYRINEHKKNCFCRIDRRPKKKIINHKGNNR